MLRMYIAYCGLKHIYTALPTDKTSECTGVVLMHYISVYHCIAISEDRQLVVRQR